MASRPRRAAGASTRRSTSFLRRGQTTPFPSLCAVLRGSRARARKVSALLRDKFPNRPPRYHSSAGRFTLVPSTRPPRERRSDSASLLVSRRACPRPPARRHSGAPPDAPPTLPRPDKLRRNSRRSGHLSVKDLRRRHRCSLPTRARCRRAGRKAGRRRRRRIPVVLLPTPSAQSCFLEAMSGLRRISFKFEFYGSRIIHFSDE
jgi:hypothetical protein